MPKIEFDFEGKTFEADVADSFLEREEQEQARILKQQLISEFETRKPERGSDEKGVLDYLALLESMFHPLFELQLNFLDNLVFLYLRKYFLLLLPDSSNLN